MARVKRHIRHVYHRDMKNIRPQKDMSVSGFCSQVLNCGCGELANAFFLIDVSEQREERSYRPTIEEDSIFDGHELN